MDGGQIWNQDVDQNPELLDLTVSDLLTVWALREALKLPDEEDLRRRLCEVLGDLRSYVAAAGLEFALRTYARHGNTPLSPSLRGFDRVSDFESVVLKIAGELRRDNMMRASGYAARLVDAHGVEGFVDGLAVLVVNLPAPNDLLLDRDSAVSMFLEAIGQSRDGATKH